MATQSLGVLPHELFALRFVMSTNSEQYLEKWNIVCVDFIKGRMYTDCQRK